MTDFIYLDHNSTTPIAASVAQTMSDCFAAGYVNPASQHRMGQRARRKLEQLRTRLAELLGASFQGMHTDQIILTSGGTESNNLALFGLPNSADTATRRVVVSSIEHPSVMGPAEQLARMGYQVDTIPVDKNGVCRLDALRELIETPVSLVSLMLANNETGVIQPVAEAAAICRKRGVLIHTDAIQAIGKIPVSFQALGVDAMSFTAHKLSGPRGTGGLVLRHGLSLQPILFGGFQQMAIRPGTEDVALIAGMVHALELYANDPRGRYDHLVNLRDRLQENLIAELKDVVINGGEADRVPQTLNLSFPGVDRQSFLMAADIAGLAVSTGSACASGSSERSPVLLAMGLENEVIDGSIRISLGISTTESEIDESTLRIINIIRRFRVPKER